MSTRSPLAPWTMQLQAQEGWRIISDHCHQPRVRAAAPAAPAYLLLQATGPCPPPASPPAQLLVPTLGARCFREARCERSPSPGSSGLVAARPWQPGLEGPRLSLSHARGEARARRLRVGAAAVAGSMKQGRIFSQQDLAAVPGTHEKASHFLKKEVSLFAQSPPDPRHPKMRPLPATASQGKSPVPP